MRGVSKVFAAKGSWSAIRGVDCEVRLFFRARGLGFCKELRTLGDEGVVGVVGGNVSVGVLDLKEGGAGAFLAGRNPDFAAASEAWSARRV